jgi:hypothetical protein
VTGRRAFRIPFRAVLDAPVLDVAVLTPAVLRLNNARRITLPARRKLVPYRRKRYDETMAVSVETGTDSTVVVQVSGKLHKADYEQFVPKLESLIHKHGKIRVLFEMHDFHGWDAGALWADVKFDMKHFKDIERLAVVGETKWEKGMATFCKPFTKAQIRYFDHANAGDARTWIQA